jgi:hypothetical protein
MEKTAVIAAKDMEPAARNWIAGVLKVELADNDQCTLMLRRPPAAPTPEQRQEAWATIQRILDKAADNMKNVPEPVFEDTLDEAMRTVRPRPQRAK